MAGITATSNASKIGLGSFTTRTNGSSSNSFLGYSDLSPVQRMLQTQQQAKAKITSYEDSEDFMRMKAFQLKAMMVTYQNLGMSDAYNNAAAEAQQLVMKYLKMQQTQKAADAAAAAGLDVEV